MTQEDKELLIKDLCGRLPYGVICDIYNEKCTITEKLLIGGLSHFCDDTIAVRPYLRPMSSMTEDERNEYFDIKMQETERVALAEVYRPEAISEIMDWLNAHHFDYRHLIEKGLALEAPEGMYNLKGK